MVWSDCVDREKLALLLPCRYDSSVGADAGGLVAQPKRLARYITAKVRQTESH
jgi:hypothetical protein